MNIAIFKSTTGDQVMVDSNAEIAFGPVFGEDEDPENFLLWLQNHGYRYFYMKDIDNNIMGRLVSGWRKEAKEVVV